MDLLKRFSRFCCSANSCFEASVAMQRTFMFRS